MILLTGAAGYIGSHTWIELVNAGKKVIGIDNFSNSNIGVLNRIETILGEKILFKNGDVRDKGFISNILNEYPIEGIIHFAAYKSVRESIEQPLKYYENNLNGLISVVSQAVKYNIKYFVFSSSCTVYNQKNSSPLNELMDVSSSSSPCGWSKIFCEKILQDVHIKNTSLKIANLRYFNPVGAHDSGLIGEDPKGLPINLMPLIAEVAIGKSEYLNIYGNDWPTKDGTCIRDFVHVNDIAIGHVMALNYIADKENSSLVVNLGSGKGFSVMEVLQTYSVVCGREIPYRYEGRRPGDIAIAFADNSQAKKLLGWIPKYDLSKMCIDSWNWKKNNSKGYLS